MFDSHCHIQFPAYDADRDEVIRRALAADVKMVAVGTQFSTSQDAIALVEKHPVDVWATVGYHPNHLSEEWYHDRKEQKETVPEAFDLDAFRKLAVHPKVVAIGECGLDYYRLTTDNLQQVNKEKEKQKEVFLAQMKLAEEVRKPLMIHCRPSKGIDDAYEDMLRILTTNNLQLATIFHFYVGSLEITKKLVDAGFYFTFGGVITFSRDYDASIKLIPLDRILAETDAPYVAPEPHRGKRNHTLYLI